MTAFSYSVFAKGGPVMWLLVLLGLVAVVIFIERTLFLHRAQIRSTEFLNGIKNLLQKDRLMEALTLCEETPGPVAKLVKAFQSREVKKFVEDSFNGSLVAAF